MGDEGVRVEGREEEGEEDVEMEVLITGFGVSRIFSSSPSASAFLSPPPPLASQPYHPRRLGDLPLQTPPTTPLIPR